MAVLPSMARVEQFTQLQSGVVRSRTALQMQLLGELALWACF